MNKAKCFAEIIVKSKEVANSLLSLNGKVFYI